tara:strand:- start:72 stop:320 length:249 start_codon:yes stop_codon:yes gene_type:complete
MASNVNIHGGNEGEFRAVGITEANASGDGHRKKVIIAGIGGSGTVTLGSSAAITVPANTFLDLGAFQGKIVTATPARAIILT